MKKSIELETAIKAAEEAGKILLERKETGKVVELKGKKHFSTNVDIESEKAIIEAIERDFPDHNILSEEAGEKEKGSKSTWIVDPLDGTKNYARGMPLFSVSIALAREKEMILGVVFDPWAKMLYYAEKGKGAFLNDERIEVSQTKSLDNATVYLDGGNLGKINSEHLNKMAEKFFRVRNFGVGSLGLCYVAQGGYDAYIGGNSTKIMDVAAGTVIAQEAGAQITDKKGGKIDLFESRKIIASNGVLHKELLEIFE